MLKKKYNEIMQKPERTRSNWALGLSTLITALILVSFGFYKGFLGFGTGAVRPYLEQASVLSVTQAPSPMQSTSEAFKSAWGEVSQKYNELKDEISNVLVPFFTSIEVYERK